MINDSAPAPVVLLHVRLYVAGTSPNSVAALCHLRHALGERPDEGVVLEVIDVLVDPQRGARDGVLVTPMLIRIAPAPERRVLGSLSDRPRLLTILCLDPPTAQVRP